MSHTANPFEPSRNIRLPIGALVTMGGFLASASMAWALVQAKTTEIDRKQEMLERRLSAIEQVTVDVATIKNDVAWIKERLRAPHYAP
jgi:hypothetical protein